jgi:hypothetical protein
MLKGITPSILIDFFTKHVLLSKKETIFETPFDTAMWYPEDKS